MSTQSAVDMLKEQHKSLDESVHGLVRVVADIKNIALDNRERLDRQDQKIDALDQKVDSLNQKVDSLDQKTAALDKGLNALAEATLTGFKRVDEQLSATRSDITALELLIRQRFPEN